MPLSSSKIKFLVGDETNCNDFAFYSALSPFDEEIIDFLDDLSKVLMSYCEYSDIVTFAFWIRRGNMKCLKKRFIESDNENNHESLWLGRGIVFHIAPSNVPVNFAYSLVTALLCGNISIVRVPTKDFPQVRIIIKAINTVLAKYPEMVGRIVCVRYDHDKEINDLFSSLSDVRIIWGGNKTIEEIRKSPLPPRSTEITFADRYSLAVIDSDAYLVMTDTDKERTAIDFYNDTFFSDQNACTSPRIVIWTGRQINKAKRQFWQLEHDLVKQKYNFQPIQAVNKLTKAYLFATNRTVKIEPHEDNLIIRVTISEITSDLMNYRDNSGYFYEYDCKDIIDITSLCNNNMCQTIAYIGCKSMFLPLLKSRVKGIDRIVPIGKTMDFALIWDGYNLPAHLTRTIMLG